MPGSRYHSISPKWSILAVDLYWQLMPHLFRHFFPKKVNDFPFQQDLVSNPCVIFVPLRRYTMVFTFTHLCWNPQCPSKICWFLHVCGSTPNCGCGRSGTGCRFKVDAQDWYISCHWRRLNFQAYFSFFLFLWALWTHVLYLLFIDSDETDLRKRISPKGRSLCLI